MILRRFPIPCWKAPISSRRCGSCNNPATSDGSWCARRRSDARPRRSSAANSESTRHGRIISGGLAALESRRRDGSSTEALAISFSLAVLASKPSARDAITEMRARGADIGVEAVDIADGPAAEALFGSQALDAASR